MANQAVETQIPALEKQTVQISFSSKDEGITQKNKLILEKENKKLETDKPYNKKYEPKESEPEKTPFVEEEEPPPEKKRLNLKIHGSSNPWSVFYFT